MTRFLWRIAILYATCTALLITPKAAAAQNADTLHIGSKKFTESVILGEVATQMMRHEGAQEVEHKRQLGGTRILWSALKNTEVDVYPEYTGTIATEILKSPANSQNLDALREQLATHGVGMTAPLGFNNTYALGMREAQAERLGIRTISDLTEHKSLTYGFSNEFMERADGWLGLKRTYGLAPEQVRGLDHDLAYKGIAEGALDVIDLYSTDAEITRYDLRVLDDDRAHFPPYEAVFLYRLDLRQRAPQALKGLKRLEGALDRARMTSMNASAKIDRRPERRIAQDFTEDAFGFVAQTQAQQGRWASIWQRTLEHLVLVGASLLLAILLAIPLGILAHANDRLGQVILSATGIVQTMPSLALLVFMIPLFGIGDLPALVALFLYSLLPIVRNTHAGLHDIDEGLIDSARALGLTRVQRLRHVELPLATRSILAGIKTAAVINVGTATLGALIGSGGYGQPILTGIRLDDMSIVLEGAIPAALLALLVQSTFDLLESHIVT